MPTCVSVKSSRFQDDLMPVSALILCSQGFIVPCAVRFQPGALKYFSRRKAKGEPDQGKSKAARTARCEKAKPSSVFEKRFFRLQLSNFVRGGCAPLPPSPLPPKDNAHHAMNTSRTTRYPPRYELPCQAYLTTFVSTFCTLLVKHGEAYEDTAEQMPGASRDRWTIVFFVEVDGSFDGSCGSFHPSCFHASSRYYQLP